VDEVSKKKHYHRGHREKPESTEKPATERAKPASEKGGRKQKPE
jgi:hypothetical protein